MQYFKRVPGVVMSMLCGCTVGGQLPPAGAGLDGTWGGLDAGLTVTPDGGTIRYGCAHGALHAPIRPDRQGRFEVNGVHVREHGGPARVGEVLEPLPARYLGKVSGDRMELRVLAGSDTLGPFTLQRGVAPHMVRCL